MRVRRLWPAVGLGIGTLPFISAIYLERNPIYCLLVTSYIFCRFKNKANVYNLKPFPQHISRQKNHTAPAYHQPQVSNLIATHPIEPKEVYNSIFASAHLNWPSPSIYLRRHQSVETKQAGSYQFDDNTVSANIFCTLSRAATAMPLSRRVYFSCDAPPTLLQARLDW